MRRILGPALFTLALVTAAPARADVVPPEVTACSGKEIGAACSQPDSVAGACAKGTCSKLDYSRWDRDAMSSPPTMQYECVKCVAGTPQTTAPASGGGCALVARRAGPWALAAVPALVLAVLGRRRGRR